MPTRQSTILNITLFLFESSTQTVDDLHCTVNSIKIIGIQTMPLNIFKWNKIFRDVNLT